MGRVVRPDRTGLSEPGKGRRPVGLERMLRIYFLQQWFNLSDPAAEDALYDSESMRRFAEIDLAGAGAGRDDDCVSPPARGARSDREILPAVHEPLDRRLLLKSGTIVDATIIEAPPSTKNEAKARDPEMKQGKKNNQWHFGMKAQSGWTPEHGLVHSLVAPSPPWPMSRTSAR